jgi:hypothetical protein
VRGEERRGHPASTQVQRGEGGGGLTLSCDVYLPAAPPLHLLYSHLPLHKHEIVCLFRFIKANFTIGQNGIKENDVKQGLFFVHIAGKHS